jgi:hypothetical protein
LIYINIFYIMSPIFFFACLTIFPSERMTRPSLLLLSFVATSALGGPVLVFNSQIAELQSPPPSYAPADTETLKRELEGLQTRWKNNEETGSRQQAHLHLAASRIRTALCTSGEKDYCPPKKKLVAKNVDLDRLAVAVSYAETSGCTAGTALSKNNCHGIFGFQNGKYGALTFNSTDESFEQFKEVWMRSYGDRFPTLEDAKRYTSGPGERWLGVVKVVYGKD